jgi:hypothetical protein
LLLRLSIHELFQEMNPQGSAAPKDMPIMVNQLDYLELKAWHVRQRGRIRRCTTSEARHVDSDLVPFEDDEAEALHGVYLPTAEQIKESCLKIQSEWSDSERQRRAGLRSAISHHSTKLAVPISWSRRVI